MSRPYSNRNGGPPNDNRQYPQQSGGPNPNYPNRPPYNQNQNQPPQDGHQGQHRPQQGNNQFQRPPNTWNNQNPNNGAHPSQSQPQRHPGSFHQHPQQAQMQQAPQHASLFSTLNIASTALASGPGVGGPIHGPQGGPYPSPSGQLPFGLAPSVLSAQQSLLGSSSMSSSAVSSGLLSSTPSLVLFPELQPAISAFLSQPGPFSRGQLSIVLVSGCNMHRSNTAHEILMRQGYEFVKSYGSLPKIKIPRSYDIAQQWAVYNSPTTHKDTKAIPDSSFFLFDYGTHYNIIAQHLRSDRRSSRDPYIEHTHNSLLRNNHIKRYPESMRAITAQAERPDIIIAFDLASMNALHLMLSTSSPSSMPNPVHILLIETLPGEEHEQYTGHIILQFMNALHLLISAAQDTLPPNTSIGKSISPFNRHVTSAHVNTGRRAHFSTWLPYLEMLLGQMRDKLQIPLTHAVVWI